MAIVPITMSGFTKEQYTGVMQMLEAARPSTHALAHRKEIFQLKHFLAEKVM
jgi:hypothetical protein